MQISITPQQLSFNICNRDIDYKIVMIVMILIVTIPSFIIFGIVIIRLALGLFVH